ncbi:hypothetical protein [Streptomyces mirabilis]|uniref:hypothetical protein n=1 Tax=Streptomyces mirabilis TaxID=68239 RepID=UPI0035E15B19
MAESFMQQLITSLARRTPVLDESVPSRTGSSDTTEWSRRPAKPHLLAEDRHDFERTLDEVLTEEAPGVTERLNDEQLRTMALTASEVIAATAASEYAHYVEVREQARTLHESEVPSAERAPTERHGASVTAVIAVLAPVLFGTAAAIFLIVGYILKMLAPEPAFAQTLLTTGWLFGALTAASVLLGMISLLVTALRDASAPPTHEEAAQSQEVAAARDVWREALRRRGIEPFLREIRNAVSRGLDNDQTP